ncbi:haloacid dehalogenase type II [Salegentibacter salegens]|uniref:2-haloacid dehalogenase n=1 Tax=Salegentibacter salegens TaxID=143223 RepID=A0A1M7JB43_9FLAO|nr:haloacid dehalogenase type II [Salegentibacter salegens]PRX39288.1 2-haloacid dehalogenase [Salegentibacter salegens]SHM50222.1 2-haloacid dehalogenase [Salegentibacter salegens]
MKPKIIIFDVNETLLNLIPLKEEINAALEHEMGFEVWFPKLLHYSLVETTTGTYNNFSEIAAATFKMISGKFDKDFSDSEIKNILSEITKLPPYPDVKPGLKQLKNAGYKLIAFSNGKPDVLNAQLKFAEIDSLFEGIYSVEEIKKYKPHPESYQYILNKYQVKAQKALMVAAHSWDIIGAQHAGLQTCFVERPGKKFYDLAEKPNFSVSEITSILEQIS